MKNRKLIRLVLPIVMLAALNSTGMAQGGKTYKEINKTLISETIHVSADSLWTILREFDKVGQWTSTLDHSEGYGEAIFEGTTCNGRVCETSVGRSNKIIEELDLFDDDKRELAYRLTEGAPGFVKMARNHWTVIEVGPNQSKVQMDVSMHLSKFMGFLLGGVITKQMTKQVNIVQAELKLYAETGEVSQAKKEQLAKQKQ